MVSTENFKDKIVLVGVKLNKVKFEKIKSQKPFSKKDFIVFAILFAVIITLFISLIFLSKKSPSKGFKVLINNDQVLEFDYKTSSAKISDNYKDKILIDYESKKIIIYIDNSKTKFNEIVFDSNKKTVKISNSTCSLSKDCVYMPHITDDKGVIYCAPHALKILPLGDNLSNSPITG